MNNNIKRKLARGICLQEESVLLCKAKNKTNYFLIGGGIEKFESASTALLREIKEELDKKACIKSFIGVIYNCWTADHLTTFETNFLFDVDISLGIEQVIKSKEQNLSFEWIKLTEIKEINLQPIIMKQVILQFQNRSNLNRFLHSEINKK